MSKGTPSAVGATHSLPRSVGPMVSRGSAGLSCAFCFICVHLWFQGFPFSVLPNKPCYHPPPRNHPMPMAETAPARETMSVALRVVLVLLGLSIFLNYIDRGNLSIAAPLLKDELGLTPWQLGILLSSFFWTYTAFQIPSGWLVDRFDVGLVLASGFLI